MSAVVFGNTIVRIPALRSSLVALSIGWGGAPPWCAAAWPTAPTARCHQHPLTSAASTLSIRTQPLENGAVCGSSVNVSEGASLHAGPGAIFCAD
jgi:hypothetical protein